MASPRDHQRDHPGAHPRDHPRDRVRDRAGGAAASLVSTPEKAEVISTMQKRWGAWGGVPMGAMGAITPDALVRHSQSQPLRFEVKGLGCWVPTYPPPPPRRGLSPKCVGVALISRSCAVLNPPQQQTLNHQP